MKGIGLTVMSMLSYNLIWLYCSMFICMFICMLEGPAERPQCLKLEYESLMVEFQSSKREKCITM